MSREFSKEWAENPELYIQTKKKICYNADNILSKLIIPHLQDNSTILDIGCGPGDLVHHFTSLGHIIDGVDTSKNMLEVASRAGYDKVKLVDASKPFIPPKEKYDVIMSAGLYGDFLNVDHLSHVLPHLNEGGILAICGRDFYLNQGLSEFIGQHGLEVLNDHTELAYTQKGNCDKKEALATIRSKHIQHYNFKKSTLSPILHSLYSEKGGFNIVLAEFNYHYRYLIARNNSKE